MPRKKQRQLGEPFPVPKLECTHRRITVLTEPDKCSWVQCQDCGKEGPKKHSYTLALLAWIVCLADKHPRK